MNQVYKQQQDAAVKQARHTPHIGDEITVHLPDERTRGTVERVISANQVIVKLVHFTTASKSHSYKKGDYVPVEYRIDGMGLKGWHEIPPDRLNAAPKDEPIRNMVAADFMTPAPKKARR